MPAYTSSLYTICTGLILHLLFTLIVTAAIPLSVHIAMLTVLMLFNGVAFGSLDNGRSTGTYEHPHRNNMPFFWGLVHKVNVVTVEGEIMHE